MTQQPIRISIIEDLKDVAISLQSIINTQDDMHCEHIFHNAEDAMQFIPNQLTNVVIVDIGLPRASGIEAISFLKNKCPQLMFCMFTVYEDDEKIFRSLQAGAKGYILKGASKDKMLDSIRELNKGGSPMSPSIARRIIDMFSEMKYKTTPAPLPLTAREMELLTLLSKGLLYKEIGDHMGITIGTVKQHIHKIYDKLEVTNKTEAINKLNHNNGQ
ncbi:MAG: response regulator transcription factor [Saprospiraceae bacterium]|nr:response regulator transcription factor [Saprospiraceae bacterium]MBL0101890.1 response regulator transcription factor [Saprospiraceae bacterium]